MVKTTVSCLVTTICQNSFSAAFNRFSKFLIQDIPSSNVFMMVVESAVEYAKSKFPIGV